MIIGYTTGVYDLFHIGHLNLLKRAKDSCDKLIVGITTDELCQEAKNKKPIIPFNERMEIVKACRYVDDVIPQTTLDKLIAWEKIHYDLLFVGDDWKGSSAWNSYEKQLSQVGAKVFYLPYTQGTSSTILSKILYKKLKQERGNE